MRGDTRILQCWVYFEKYKKKSYHTASVFFLRFYCFSFQYSFLWLSFPFFFQLKQQQYMPLIQNKQYSGKSKSFSAFEREYFSIEFEIQSFPVPRTLQHSTVNILQKISTELQPGMTSWSSSDAISRQTSEKIILHTRENVKITIFFNFHLCCFCNLENEKAHPHTISQSQGNLRRKEKIKSSDTVREEQTECDKLFMLKVLT